MKLPSPPRRRHLALAAAALLAGIVLLTWLYLRADTVAPQSHFDYAQELRHLRQADAELNAAVLASRYGLLADFDPLVAQGQALRRSLAAAAQPPAFLAEADRSRVLARVEALRQLLAQKEDMIDRFKRESSVLRNSLDYFPGAAENFLEDYHAGRHERLDRYVRQLLVFTRNAEPERAQALEKTRQGLLAGSGRDRAGDAMANLLLHGRFIQERQPAVDRLTREILHLPTAAAQETLVQAYAEGHDRALTTATRYRTLLYASGLLLVGYLGLVFFRLEGARRALAAAHDDLAQQLDAQRRTEQTLRLYATVFTNAAEGMIICDQQNRIAAVNPAFTAITGYGLDDVAGKSPGVLRSGRHEPGFYHQMWSQLQSERLWRGEIWNRRRNGEVFPEWLSISAVLDDQGAVRNYIGIFSDVTERKAAEARIHHLAYHDALTGLPNRILLEDRLEQAILQSRRSGHRTAVLFLDLDRFKNINDTLGHKVGDILLVQVSARCADLLRETDTICRQGGDEFVIVLPDLESDQDAAHVARKIVRALAKPFLLSGHELTVTGSIGIALFPDDGRSASELLRNADAAMYRTKAEGRNGYQFYSADMNVISLSDLLLESQLRGAIGRDELVLDYQPKIDAASGAPRGFEALLRWQHPEQGLIPPARFIPLAEECGLIGAIGEWVLGTACSQLRNWMDAGLPALPMSVNISADQFAHQDVLAVVDKVLTRTGIPPALLELELTETLLMRNVDRATTVLSQLRQRGVGLAIDDFGTGYSSLSYLKQFPVHTLKVDKSFVADIAEADDTAKIAGAIIALAHGLDLQVIAEGVETEAQRRYLLEHGCDQFQGFLFSLPLSATQATAWLRSRLPVA
jgi:diguanylate cyclase (GGDEF)-like protein/PAS domain S-box-containing protein